MRVDASFLYMTGIAMNNYTPKTERARDTPTKYTVHGSHILAHTTFCLVFQIFRDKVHGGLKVFFFITIWNKSCDLCDKCLAERPNTRGLPLAYARSGKP